MLKISFVFCKPEISQIEKCLQAQIFFQPGIDINQDVLLILPGTNIVEQSIVGASGAKNLSIADEVRNKVPYQQKSENNSLRKSTNNGHNQSQAAPQDCEKKSSTDVVEWPKNEPKVANEVDFRGKINQRRPVERFVEAG